MVSVPLIEKGKTKLTPGDWIAQARKNVAYTTSLKALTAQEEADKWTKEGIPATVNTFGQVVRKDQCLPKDEKPQRIIPVFPLDSIIRTRANALDEELDKLHHDYQGRFSNVPFFESLKDTRRQQREYRRELEEMGAIPTPREARIHQRQVELPITDMILKITGDRNILLNEPMSASTVKKLITNQPARLAAAKNPAIIAEKQKLERDYQYGKYLRRRQKDKKSSSAQKGNQPKLF